MPTNNQTTVPSATVTTTTPMVSGQPNVVYVEKKSKTWVYVLVGVLVAVLCCCGAFFALMGTGLLTTLQLMGPATQRFTAGVTALDTKYSQYKNNQTFKDCVNKAMQENQAQMQTDLQNKMQTQANQDPTSAMNSVVDALLSKMDSSYSSCASKVSGTQY